MKQQGLITRRSLIAAAGFAAAVPAFAAQDETWPRRPIRLVVPFAAGNGLDVVARLISEPLANVLGQPVIVDNRPGAAGVIGAHNVAKSPPDGHTFLLSPDSLITLMPHIKANLVYDPFKDFAPVTRLTSVPLYLITTPNQPFESVAQLISAAKARPGAINYGSYGVGSSAHTRMEYFNNLAGTKMMHVPYGNSPLPELLAGLVQVSFDSGAVVLPMLQGKKIRVLAVTSLKRTAALPDVPTVAEALAGYEADGWHGVYFPKGTPAPIVERMNAELIRIIRDSKLKQRLSDLGIEAAGTSVAELDRFAHSEFAKWGRIAREHNIRMD